MGSTEARLIKYAKLIQSQEQVDMILSRVSPQVQAAWLDKFAAYLKFKPAQLTLEPVQSGQSDLQQTSV